jgi:hypothetical protein
MSYYQKIPALSAVADSGDNWLLVSNSSIYLYATLVQASSYLMDPQAGSMWDGLLARAVGELESSDDKSRFAGGTLTMRPKYIYT